MIVPIYEKNDGSSFHRISFDGSIGKHFEFSHKSPKSKSLIQLTPCLMVVLMDIRFVGRGVVGGGLFLLPSFKLSQLINYMGCLLIEGQGVTN